MPTYSYRCTECGNAFDIHQAFSDDALTVCEVCGGKLRKLFNTIGVTFNGSGFYRTDSRSGSGSGSSDGGSSKSGAASSGGSTTASGSSGGSSPAKSGSTSQGTGGSTSTSSA